MSKEKYSHNWPKVSKIIRRIAGICEVCQQVPCTSVHHIGSPYVDGRPGNPHDKHDLRRENLAALCETCHFQADLPLLIAHKRKKRIQERHKALNIGTGIVVYGASVPVDYTSTSPWGAKQVYRAH